jgi:hypothetical protein
MAQVNFYGVSNDDVLGKVTVNKTVEIEDAVARKILGPNKINLIRWILQNHCPDIDISPKRIGIKITYRREAT